MSKNRDELYIRWKKVEYRFFAFIGKKLAWKIKYVVTFKVTFKVEERVNTIYLQPTDKQVVLNIITDLKYNSSAGMDKIASKDLKKLRNVMRDILETMINDIIETGVFSENLRTANINTGAQNGKREDINNYKPISWLRTFSKLVEK